MRGTLIEILDRLDAVDDSDGFDPPIIFAVGGANARPTASACVCPVGEDDSGICPDDPQLSEVLMVGLAKSAIRVWSSWRNGRRPTPEDKYAAVMYYTRHDAYLPLE